MLVKVAEDTSLVRDVTTGAILNTNKTELEAYKQRKQREQKLLQLEKDTNCIKNELQEIKHLLRALMEHGK